MQVLKPEVVDADQTKATEDISTISGDTLSATGGSLRFSTEDLDIPLNDTISVYEVKKGDTIASVAKAYGVSRNTIIWANDIKGSTLTIGDTLVILPITGIKYTIRKGDTVSSIAKKYKADIDDITKYNGITKDADLAVGDVILLPEGEIAVAQAPASSKKRPSIASRLATTPLGFFVRPLQGGLKTQGIHGHNAVDIAAQRGTPVVATANGRVIIARMGGYNGGYGNMIVITHENNIQTLYAHLKDVYITPGSTVTQGQVIGTVGNTGRSTGPHLHIEVRGAVNPF
jgi:LysM repeat protein